MSRKPRVEYTGAVYHTVQRGVNQEDIFAAKRDKSFFLKVLQEEIVGKGCVLLGYVIMDNHYHLLVQTLVHPLHKLMQQVNSRFAQYYNWLHNRSGHVFQGRYKAMLIQDDRYLLAVLRYIHQNPVRARLCEKVSDYRWSSENDYRKNTNSFVNTEFILNILSENRKIAGEEYVKLMAEVPSDEENEVKGSRGRVESEFIYASTVLGKPVSSKNIEGLNEILRRSCKDEQVYILIKSGSRERSLTETKLNYIRSAREIGYTVQQIGEQILMSSQAVLNLLRRRGQ